MLHKLFVLCTIFAIMNTFFYAYCTYKTAMYIDSKQEALDRLRGNQSNWPSGRWLLLATLFWSAVYLTYE